MTAAFVVGVLGAESTGKTELVEGLAQRLAVQPGWSAGDIGVVPEVLRAFCDRAARTPRQDEQAGIAREQTQRITDAASRHRLVLADTTSLMTAVYSEQVFGDRSLYPTAIALHARVDQTLVTALDLPWVADGLQRDGPAVREAVDGLLRRALADAGIGWSLVQGRGDDRIDSALRALRGPLLERGEWPGDGVFSRTVIDDAAGTRRVRWQAACECCTDPDSEAADWALRLQRRARHDERR